MLKLLSTFLLLVFLFSCSEPGARVNTPTSAVLSARDNRITFETIKDNVHIQCGITGIEIPGSGISPVYVDGRGPDSLVMIDYNQDGNFILLVLINDIDRTGASHLMGIKLGAGMEEPVEFKTSGDFSDTLNIKSHLLIVQGNEYLYACNSDTIKFGKRMISIDKYKWSRQEGYFTFLGSKVFDSLPAKTEDFKF
ncbi:hypothetical protein [Chitinophaga dinghuensis]|nr:hypothetical protein [Chitinophaga dinghuensis]